VELVQVTGEAAGAAGQVEQTGAGGHVMQQLVDDGKLALIDARAAAAAKT
jgi:hypothetical protein